MNDVVINHGENHEENMPIFTYKRESTTNEVLGLWHVNSMAISDYCLGDVKSILDIGNF